MNNIFNFGQIYKIKISITPIKKMESKFPVDMHIYTLCPSLLQSFRKFCWTISEELHWQEKQDWRDITCGNEKLIFFLKLFYDSMTATRGRQLPPSSTVTLLFKTLLFSFACLLINISYLSLSNCSYKQ